ncbi:MAG: hypothetical protein GY854_26070 [Deltaproteobacteria bacterium]|nr:hypothetical protein [Deltaproteobacteria bacterium]
MRDFLTIAICCFLGAACARKIGDACEYDVNCSENMDRNCDRSQPGGYCLEIGCGPDECPNEAVCVEFTTPCPEGMDTNECRLIEPNRGRSYCLKHCNSDGGCRKKYFCAEPEEFSAAIIDFDTNKEKICVPESDD